MQRFEFAEFEPVLSPELVMFAGATALNSECRASGGKLSFRQLEILDEIAQGFSNPEIAGRLFLSIETVKSHRRNIKSILEVPTIIGAINDQLQKGGIWVREGEPANRPLTQREKEILVLMAQGLNNPEIAKILFVTSETVKTHVQHILEALGARNRIHAVIRGYQTSELEPPRPGLEAELAELLQTDLT